MEEPQQRAQRHDQRPGRANAAPAALPGHEAAHVAGRDRAQAGPGLIRDRGDEQASEAQVVADRARRQAPLGAEVAGVVRQQPLVRRCRTRRGRPGEDTQPAQVLKQRPKSLPGQVVPVACCTPGCDVALDFGRDKLRGRKALNRHPAAEVPHQLQLVDSAGACVTLPGKLCTEALGVRAKRSGHPHLGWIFHRRLLSPDRLDPAEKSRSSGRDYAE